MERRATVHLHVRCSQKFAVVLDACTKKNFFPYKFPCFYEISTCYSNLTVRNFSRVLRAVFMKWDFSSRWNVSHKSDNFHPGLIWEKYPTEWDTFHPSYPACLLLSSYVTFILYLFFCIYFNFELLINIRTAKLIRWIAFFHGIIAKAHRV